MGAQQHKQACKACGYSLYRGTVHGGFRSPHHDGHQPASSGRIASYAALLVVVYSVLHGYLFDHHTAESGDGKLVSDVMACSHAVLRHRQQESYFKAKERQEMGEDICIVTAEWVLLSSVRKEMMPGVSNHGVHGCKPCGMDMGQSAKQVARKHKCMHVLVNSGKQAGDAARGGQTNFCGSAHARRAADAEHSLIKAVMAAASDGRCVRYCSQLAWKLKSQSTRNVCCMKSSKAVKCCSTRARV